MTEIVGVTRARNVNIAQNWRNVICTSRKVDGRGCKGCSFCGVESLCIQPARVNTAYEVIQLSHH